MQQPGCLDADAGSLDRLESAGDPPEMQELCRQNTFDRFEYGEPQSKFPEEAQENAQENAQGPPAGAMVMLPVMACGTEVPAGVLPAACPLILRPHAVSGPLVPMLPTGSSQGGPLPAVAATMALPKQKRHADAAKATPAAALPGIADEVGKPCMELLVPPAGKGVLPVAAPRPQTLVQAFDVNAGVYRVSWVVDARKLKANDKQGVSPEFQISCSSGSNMIFKMMMYPKAKQDGKGSVSFKKAKGRGFIQLKCESETVGLENCLLSFRMGTSSAIGQVGAEPPRGPVTHDFTQNSTCGLSRGSDEWDFSKVVDEAAQTFVIYLEILP